MSSIVQSFAFPLFAPGNSVEVVVPAGPAEKLREVGLVGSRTAGSQAHYQQGFADRSWWADLEQVESAA